MNAYINIVESVAMLSEPTRRGYSKQLNWVTLGERGAVKLDIRTWQNGDPCKGISLSDQEAHRLYEALKEIYEGKEKDHGTENRNQRG